MFDRKSLNYEVKLAKGERRVNPAPFCIYPAPFCYERILQGKRCWVHFLLLLKSEEFEGRNIIKYGLNIVKGAG